ncbi:MAG: 2Fe-2S iron-sulfur cluster-binding protein, partial [Alphaproteobacteria bacterium]|nr:2Fe-2S iron-sulfur cluster-binding protein [Alphaproteobacteria bacterium]
MRRIGAKERITLSLNVNGRRRVGMAMPRTLLSDFLRHEVGLPGTHVGCEHGVCGACTILIDGRAERTCLTLAVQAEGCELVTIEDHAE